MLRINILIASFSRAFGFLFWEFYKYKCFPFRLYMCDNTFRQISTICFSFVWWLQRFLVSSESRNWWLGVVEHQWEQINFLPIPLCLLSACLQLVGLYLSVCLTGNHISCYSLTLLFFQVCLDIHSCFFVVLVFIISIPVLLRDQLYIFKFIQSLTSTLNSYILLPTAFWSYCTSNESPWSFFVRCSRCRLLHLNRP